MSRASSSSARLPLPYGRPAAAACGLPVAVGVTKINCVAAACGLPAVARAVHRDCCPCLASVFFFFSCARLRRRSSRTVPLRAATSISSAHDRFNLFDESFDKHRPLLNCGRALAAAWRPQTSISSAHDRFNLFDESFDKHRSLLTCGRALAAAWRPRGGRVGVASLWAMRSWDSAHLAGGVYIPPGQTD